MNSRSLPVILLLFSLSACTNGGNKKVTPPRTKRAHDLKLIEGNSEFSLSLYKQLSREPGNLFFSPYSISSALAMTYKGAKGKTASQMKKTLCFQLESDALHKGFAGLGDDFADAGKRDDLDLTVANALWGQKGYKFLPEFTGSLKKNYQAGFQELDFKVATEPSRKTINDWVSKKTNGLIKDLLKPGIIKPDTRLVLTNAIYFKGQWETAFTKSRTADEDFYVSKSKTVKVPLMNQSKEEFKIAYGAGLKMLELPYKGQMSMLVLLPDEKDGLGKVEAQLSPAMITELLKKAYKTEVRLALPRFKLTEELSLRKTLTAMGMPVAFGAKADFSGIDGTKELKISEVVHKAFVDVNEEGTTAAAATAVVMAEKASAAESFRADHPFIFIIRDQLSGTILFMGRVADPSK
ncbi:MAG: serpin family protein [Planctomycetota bacterium]|nr:serpin family protein [Planctomycetota bacterium]